MKCIRCGVEINPKVMRIRGGGRLACCRKCIKKFEGRALLKAYGSEVELNKPLFDIILSL